MPTQAKQPLWLHKQHNAPHNFVVMVLCATASARLSWYNINPERKLSIHSHGYQVPRSADRPNA